MRDIPAKETAAAIHLPCTHSPTPEESLRAAPETQSTSMDTKRDIHPSTRGPHTLRPASPCRCRRCSAAAFLHHPARGTSAETTTPDTGTSRTSAAVGPCRLRSASARSVSPTLPWLLYEPAQSASSQVRAPDSSPPARTR